MQDRTLHDFVQGGQLGCKIKPKKKSDFSTRGCVLYNAHGRAIGPRLGLSGGSWPILRPWQDRSQHRFLQNQVPEKQLVWTCQAGPSTSRGLVNTWWSQTWHSLSRARGARHDLHAPRGMQTGPFGLHKVHVVYTAYAVYVYTEFTHSLHALTRHVNHE